jgi:hypothetical protein
MKKNKEQMKLLMLLKRWRRPPELLLKRLYLPYKKLKLLLIVSKKDILEK